MIDYPIEIDKWRSYFEAGARPSSDEGLAMLDEIERLRAALKETILNIGSIIEDATLIRRRAEEHVDEQGCHD